MFYKFALFLVRFALLFVFRLKVEGQENIPSAGGVIVVFNHRSNWDPVIAGVSCPRKLHFMAKEELFKNPFFGRLIKVLGAFPVSRGRGDIGAVKAALKLLASDEVMLMFPEGHRVKEGETLPAKAGVAAIAQRAQIPVVPARISGQYKWMSRIKVRYGEPMYIDKEKKNQTELQTIADGIMNTVRELV